MWYTINDNTIDLRANIKYIPVLSAAEIAIREIMSKFPPPYHLMVSGGIDSQAVIYLWKLFGKDFIPTSVRYNNGLNDHDLETLPDFAAAQNVDIQYIDFDLLTFYDRDYPILAEQYNCVSPHFGAHLGMTADLEGTVIFSGDFIQNTVYVKQRSTIWPGNLCLHTASKFRSIVPYFFISSPQLAYSYLYEIISRDLPHDIENLYQSKVDAYRSCGLPVIMQKQKFTGFERVKDYYDIHYKDFITPEIKIKYRLNHSRRTYDLLLRYPYEKKYGTPIFHFLFNKLQDKKDLVTENRAC